MGNLGASEGICDLSGLGGPWWSGEPRGVREDLGESGGNSGSLGRFQGVWGTSGHLGDLRESEGTSGSLRGPREVWGDLGESGRNLGSLGGPQGIWRYHWESEGLRDLGDHCLTERNQ